MKKLLFKSIVFTGLLSVVAACEHLPVNRLQVKNPQLVAAPNAATLRLAEAADRASRSLETLAAVEKASNPEAAIAKIPNAPQELRRTMSLRWYGPAEQVVRQIADRAGYTFQSFGNAPPTPVIVALNSTDRQLIDLLRDTGLQMGSLADLKVNAANRSIEIYYPSPIEPNKEVR